MTKTKDKSTKLKGFTVGIAKPTDTPALAAGAATAEVTLTHTVAVPSRRKRKKLTDSGVGALGSSAATAKVKATKNVKSRKGSTAASTPSDTSGAAEEVRHALESEVGSEGDSESDPTVKVMKRDQNAICNLPPLVHTLRSADKRQEEEVEQVHNEVDSDVDGIEEHPILLEDKGKEPAQNRHPAEFTVDEMLQFVYSMDRLDVTVVHSKNNQPVDARRRRYGDPITALDSEL
ncbi:hypothetical protein SARC_01845 [Sphaeroforma arctica JP610]|uniref:Uncharacterized protein n=1 Tax=Sphaeroforma arctica JP610 TaxID=667725 RepID=A0A0L0GAI3_9EUKA|nr:hypothetical protein SARC_01845 [Sphaeroforma arctica JP610]KNC86000.1 hypothetical protein SARC_01845 [Sphaeroforma arctica JP610]|eukprot:XP_014159902.1 hypothetical protein SARC_01845 [Sphaeroforma arctica JP610]